MAPLQTFGIALPLALLLAGCGGGEEGDGEGDDGGGSATYGACARDDGTTQSCIEITASAADVENQREGCLDAGGSWSDEPCPAPVTGACCDYTFGNEFRECVYDATRGASLETRCLDMFPDSCRCETFPG